MSTLHHRHLPGGLFALALSIGVSGSAQTTFSSSNNPAAQLRVERLTEQGTVIRIEQNRSAVGYQALSQESVLRDPATGISYPLRGLDSEVLPACTELVDGTGEKEIVTLQFAPFLDPISRFELIDPAAPTQSLYVKGIEFTTPDAIASSDEGFR